MPVEKLDRKHAQPAAEMRREQHDDAPLGKLHERLLGPAQELVQLQTLAKRPEVHRQEKRERQARDAVDQRYGLHAKTPSTARMPSHAKATPKARTKISRDLP